LIAARIRFYSLFLALGIFSGLAWTLFIRVQQNIFAPAFIEDSDLNLVSILKEYGPRLDNYWTSTVGLFGWIDHTGFQLLEQLWISVIVIYFGLVIILATLRQKISSALLLVGSVILAPIGIYLLLFTDGVGYQARYAMALSCALPIFLAAFSLRNKAQEYLSLVLITPMLVLLAYFSSWSKSGFRYWLGLPFRTPDGDELAGATYWAPGWVAMLGLIAFITFTWMILNIAMNTLRSREL
jgi:hypothetical protein